MLSEHPAAKMRKTQTSEKPACVFQENNFRLVQNNTLFCLLGKNPIGMKTAIAIGGRAAMMFLHALCVFLCTPLFDC